MNFPVWFAPQQFQHQGAGDLCQGHHGGVQQDHVRQGGRGDEDFDLVQYIVRSNI